jgi:hypothetical protein
MRRTLLPLCTLTALGTLLLGAQSPPPATAPVSKPAASPCAAPERRQFDFWVGSWTVKDPQGNPSGTSEITRDAAGCAILEHWSGAGGAPGISLNYYDPATGRWHQHWVGGGGLAAHLEGAFKDGVMTMTGERRDAQGAFTTRLRWTPQPDGGVRQEWDQSRDGGKTWQVQFVGLYRKTAST